MGYLSFGTNTNHYSIVIFKVKFRFVEEKQLNNKENTLGGSFWTEIIRDRTAVSYLFNTEVATRQWLIEQNWTPEFTSP